MENVKRFENISGYHVNTMKLIDFMKPLSKAGTIIPIEKMNAVTGENHAPLGNGYARIRSAIRYLLKSNRVIWQWVRGDKSFRCLSATESVDHCDHERKLIKRRSRRTFQKLATVDTAQLDDNKRIEHHALVAQIGTLVALSDSKTVKKLCEMRADKPMEIGKALEMFKE